MTFASYVFFRYANQHGGHDSDGGSDYRVCARTQGFPRITTHKMKGGVFPPEHELECYELGIQLAPPGWVRLIPHDRWADPHDEREPFRQG